MRAGGCRVWPGHGGHGGREIAEAACRVVVALAFLLLTQPARAQDEGLPWFTGPLLVPTALTGGAGALWVQPYLFAGEGLGIASGGLSLRNQTTETTLNPQLLLGYGFTDQFEMQLDLQAIWSFEDGASSFGTGDTALEIHYQIFGDDPEGWRPAVRTDYLQYFPTGSYDELDAAKKGTDARGTGAWASVFALNLTKTFFLGDEHFLRPHLTVLWALPRDVDVRGLNTYGGGSGTDGTVDPGNAVTAYVSGEYSFNRHWAFAFDSTWTWVGATRFHGFAGSNPDGTPATVGMGSGYQITISPQVEYCIDADQGIVAGPWVTVAGHNTQSFVNFVVTYLVTFDVGTPW